MGRIAASCSYKSVLIKKWDDDQYNSEDNIPLSEWINPSNAYDDTLREDNDDFEVSDNESDELIIEQDIQQAKMSFSKAIESINNLIKWFEENDDANQVADPVNIRTKMVKSYYTKEKKTNKPRLLL